MMSLFFLIIALVPMTFIADGLIEGEVRAKGGSYRRADEPRWFWAMIGLYGVSLAYLIYLAVDVARL
ncbi:MAG: hypothetical protein AVDCRST_MAG93-1870 [uncultured Chloroflexia bacterium]|uniref:Uncharacterized protein n=1 Tax=uncultured Chloroflexia bacterium TaxID=1672391 RepID=A0A6J4ILT7_9CHLR|nr:MAG: hypothetical protein AVDCRST_MAG93-1870 [uncultured Chloroflexia bacterium]